MNEIFDSFIPLFAVPFFKVEFAFRKKNSSCIAVKKYLLPSFHTYFEEEVFADVYAAWDTKALYFHFFVKNEPVQGKDPRKSDSIELFFHTKPSDTRTIFTQFCHHFLLYPQPVDGLLFRENTKFRTEETHPLVAQKDVSIETKESPGKYFLECTLPFSVLHGYEKKESFTFFYRINRKNGSPQSSSASHQEYDPQKTPLLWTKVFLEQ